MSQHCAQLYASQLKARNDMNQKHANQLQAMKQEHLMQIQRLMDAHELERNEQIVSQSEERKALSSKHSTKEFNLQRAVMLQEFKQDRTRQMQASLVPLPAQITASSFQRPQLQRFPLRQAPRLEATEAKRIEMCKKSAIIRKQDRMGLYKAKTWKNNAAKRAPVQNQTKFARMRTTVQQTTVIEVTSRGSNKTDDDEADERFIIDCEMSEEYVVADLPPKTPRYTPTY